MRLKPLALTAAAAFLVTASLQSGARAQSESPSIITDQREVTVTVDNFIRAATETEMAKYLALSGGVNRLFHVRQPTSIAQQPTIRMNRDTLYSMAIVDISEGATLTLPDTQGRYMTAMIVNQDHYINAVFSGGGSYKMDQATFDTPYVIVVMRTLVDASDPKDVAKVNALQDQIKVEAKSSKHFIKPNYDEDSFQQVLKASLELSRSTPDSRRTFGSKKDVDPVRHFLGTAFGWGGLPETEAFYLNVDPSLPVGQYKIEVPAEVPVEAFWSISLYNAKGFYQQNPLNAYNINSVTGQKNADGSVTVHLGGCDDGRTNCLPIMEGWNYAVRLYRPKAEILDGSWQFPSVEPVQ